jgi:DNA-binding XRE family transcriptional regulator
MSVEFGKHMKTARLQQSLSMNELAQRTQIRKNCLYAYEAGEHEPKISFALAIAEVLNVSLDDLVKGVKK